MAAEQTISQNKISANNEPSRPQRSHPIASPFEDEIVPEQRPPRPSHWRDQFPPTDYSRWPLKETGDEAWSYWLLAIAGVTFAGAVYGLPFLILGAIFGFIIAGFFSIVLAAPFAIAVRTLCGRWRHPLAAPCFGGLVGFVSTSAVWEEVWRWDDGFVFFLLGPMTTTLIGQAGGYLMTRRDQAAMLAQRPSRRGGWRFSIRTALIATAWTAMTLTLLEVLGMTNGRVLAVIALWLPWQVVLLWGWWRLGLRATAKTAREEGSFT
jgi:hypothetical protein